ncbi:patatin-like phospholipase family protein [Corynebacterium tapiri]|uniref:Patatin family protein n=1 Tax=Corynebacterium tapiri TaxID=1448266 RepID=A0A5C4U8F2_9CORY|nr:patatin family protein [Corynebacterium tapiri]TNM00457.1 patatin family protein [Corynebacterium tapiri]
MNHQTIDAHEVALIIEGGGMRAAVTAPAIVKLIEEDVRFGWVGGISAGSSHAANYLSGDARRARESFTNFAGHPEFGGWGSFMRGRGYFNAEFIYENSAEDYLPYDFEAFLNHPAQLHIEGTRVDTGEGVAWTRKDIKEPVDLFKRVRASSTLPGLMRTPAIDGVHYVDGALGSSGGLLIQAARDAGFSKFAVLSTRERGYRKPPVRSPRAVRQLARRTPAVAEAMINRPSRYNASAEQIARLEKNGDALVFHPTARLVSTGERDPEKLAGLYEEGRAQFEQEWPQWLEFLSA